jgi:hypothetical protein
MVVAWHRQLVPVLSPVAMRPAIATRLVQFLKVFDMVTSNLWSTRIETRTALCLSPVMRITEIAIGIALQQNPRRVV